MTTDGRTFDKNKHCTHPVLTREKEKVKLGLDENPQSKSSRCITLAPSILGWYHIITTVLLIIMPKQSSSTFLALGATATAGAIAYFAYKNLSEKKKKDVDPRARVFESKEDVSKDLCAFIVEKAQEAIEKRGVFHLAVAGGSLLDLLGGLADHKETVDFGRVVLSFVNHKCVAPTSEKSNVFKSKTMFADAAGITKLVLPTSKPNGWGDGSKEAEFYAKALVAANIPHSGKYPIFDLVLLGLGTDGHVGSCRPMSVAALDSAKGVTGSPKTGEPSSITLTIESMNMARQICVVVCGGDKGKKEAVKRAIVRPAESPRGIFPAQSLNAPLFFLDADAAALL